MLKENITEFQNYWMKWVKLHMDDLIRMGYALSEALQQERGVFALGMGKDHWFAEELTSRLQGHPEVIGMYPEELMEYDRHFTAISKSRDYGEILLSSWNVKRNDLILCFNSDLSVMMESLQKKCVRKKIDLQNLNVSEELLQDEATMKYLPAIEVYCAQAVNAVSFAVEASLDPVEVLHQLNGRLNETLEKFASSQQLNFDKLFADLERKQGRLFVMGSGHSSMLQDYFASYPCEPVVPILESELMVYDPVKSEWTQRQKDYAQMLIDKYEIREEDGLILPSNSGKSLMNVELARILWSNRTTVTVITNMLQSPVIKSEHPSGRRLFETADIVIDNCCVNKDACLMIAEQKRCPLSSVILMLCGIEIHDQLSR